MKPRWSERYATITAARSFLGTVVRFLVRFLSSRLKILVFWNKTEAPAPHWLWAVEMIVPPLPARPRSASIPCGRVHVQHALCVFIPLA